MDHLPLPLLDNLLVDIINRCRNTEKRSRLLLHSEFASENPERLAKLVSKICLRLIDHLVLLRSNYENDPVNLINDIRIIDDFVRELGANLRYVDGAIATKLPWSLPQPLQSLAEKILPGTSLMLRPQWKYNYSILVPDLIWGYREELNNILPRSEVKVLFKDAPSNFHIISFPAVERRTALLHSDLAHEIGHLVAKRFIEFEEETSTYLVALTAEIANKLQTEAGRNKSELKESVRENLSLAISVRSFGLAEIIADGFAMRLLGPAALFALLQMAIGDSLDLQPTESNSFYPPWRTRLRYALRALTKSGLIPIGGDDKSKKTKQVRALVQRRIKDISELASETTDLEVIAEDWIIKLAYESIDNTVQQIDDFLESNYADLFLKPKKLYREVYSLIERLEQRLPPNAIEKSSYESRPVDLETILNAAWFFRIACLRTPFLAGTLNETFQKDYRILNRLTLKAIEFSYVQQLFVDWRFTEEANS